MHKYEIQVMLKSFPDKAILEQTQVLEAQALQYSVQ